MGLVIFGAVTLYLIISLTVVLFAARTAKKSGKSPWRWGGVAAVVMYLLVFWDHMPTVLVHKYYCEKESGFWAYKSIEKWTTENPEVMKTLVPVKKGGVSRNGDMRNYVDTYSLNQRFNWVIKKNGPLFINRWRHEQEVVDTKTGEVLARYIDFSTGYGELAVGGTDWRIVKFWLRDDHCSNGALYRDKTELIVQHATDPLGRNKK